MPMPHNVITKYNPANGGLLYEIPFSTPAEIDTAIEAAHYAQQQWSLLPLEKRLAVLKSFCDNVREEAETLAHCVTQEVGKPLTESYQADVLSALGGTQHALARGKHLFKSQMKQSLKGLALGRVYKQLREPKGVVGVISPWNYPLGTPTAALIGALLAGNTVVFKPSEKTPKCGEHLVRLLHDALIQHHCSTHVVQLLQGDGSVGQAMVESPHVQYIFFTGSEGVGKRIQRICVERSIECSLELGGSDAMIILPSIERYSLDAVVSHALWGRFSNAGQTCAAIKRLYIPNALMSMFKELLTAKLLAIRTGNPLEPTTHMGPVIDERQRNQLEEQLQDAKAHGAEWVQAPLGFTPEVHQSYMPPTLVFNPPFDALVNQQEVFGPILPVFGYDNLAEVRDTLNASPYGLGASIFGKPKQAEWLAKQLDVANIAINDLHMTFYAMPQLGWRGWKASGPGVRMSDEGLLQFVRIKTLGKAPLFGVLGLAKPAWLFSRQGHETTSSKALVETLGSGHWLGYLHPKLAKYMLERRSSTRL
jgi:succinate-semialdehyde dehydrogenase / glutarate-semialdehyde dehydrogenase